MEKVIYDEKNGLWYELQGDYYIPCLKLPDGVTEQLKADNQSAWAGRMNNICQRAAELVNTDLIYG